MISMQKNYSHALESTEPFLTGFTNFAPLRREAFHLILFILLMFNVGPKSKKKQTYICQGAP